MPSLSIDLLWDEARVSEAKKELSKPRKDAKAAERSGPAAGRRSYVKHRSVADTELVVALAYAGGSDRISNFSEAKHLFL